MSTTTTRSRVLPRTGLELGRVGESVRRPDGVPKVKGEFATSQSDAEFQNLMESELVAAYQKLTAEMERLLKSGYRRPKNSAVGGIPVDSEYIIFVVDTSGSMQEYNWRAARTMLNEILDM